ncbi:MAG: hypothetical protein NW223_06340 [Hyphomicrobiaceae bacterium]|nr:hypothetical protein [Hyphomicrobiaceae bacterium]
MSKIIICALAGASIVLLGGCLRKPVPPPQLSLKDDVAKPPKAAAETPPKPKPSLAIDERARAEQWERCAQRHLDYQAGKLNETVEQKQLRDDICAELHRTDHARQ